MSHTECLQEAHHLIDRVEPSRVPALVEVIKSMLDPVARAIANAPYDDEPESEEERAAVAAAMKQHREHPEESIPFEELLNEYGLATTPEGRLVEIATGQEFAPST